MKGLIDMSVVTEEDAGLIIVVCCCDDGMNSVTLQAVGVEGSRFLQSI
jgi:metal-dependent hydrolase (beta-lactamase superfamily II)